MEPTRYVYYVFICKEREIGWLIDFKQLIPVIVEAIPKSAG